MCTNATVLHVTGVKNNLFRNRNPQPEEITNPYRTMVRWYELASY